MANGYLGANQAIAPSATWPRAAVPVDLDRGDRRPVEARPPEEDSELDWFVSLLVESNATTE